MTPSSRDPHEPYVREALAHMRGLRDRPGSGRAHDHEPHRADHRFALPTIEPLRSIRPPDSPDW